MKFQSRTCLEASANDLGINKRGIMASLSGESVIALAGASSDIAGASRHQRSLIIKRVPGAEGDRELLTYSLTSLNRALSGAMSAANGDHHRRGSTARRNRREAGGDSRLIRRSDRRGRCC